MKFLNFQDQRNSNIKAAVGDVVCKNGRESTNIQSINSHILLLINRAHVRKLLTTKTRTWVMTSDLLHAMKPWGSLVFFVRYLFLSVYIREKSRTYLHALNAIWNVFSAVIILCLWAFAIARVTTHFVELHYMCACVLKPCYELTAWVVLQNLSVTTFTATTDTLYVHICMHTYLHKTCINAKKVFKK